MLAAPLCPSPPPPPPPNHVSTAADTVPGLGAKVEEGEEGAEAGGGGDDGGSCIHMLAPPCSTSLCKARELEGCEVGFGVLGLGRIRGLGV